MEQEKLSNSGIYIGISWKLQIIFTLLFTVFFGIAYLWAARGDAIPISV